MIGKTKGDRHATYRYDYFGRLLEKNEEGLTTVYAYDAWGSRTRRTTRVNGLELSEERAYDRYGRLVEIRSSGKSVQYEYDHANRVSRQIVNGLPIDYRYTKYNRLAARINNRTEGRHQFELA